ncbi:MAG: hypothetical protein CMD02_03900 [Flavobacteriales bacterium]|nr:hypothetical protein [Flavobacteriales bacterium]|tara:strand:- start:4778 stop:7258 length:2481 start_codon:yes stop_codon:yes gene_type:complete
MKKIFLSILFCGLSIITLSQNVNSQNASFLPSNVNLSELKPSDIPSEQVLRQMGLSEDEVKEALDFKNSIGVYSENTIDTNSGFSEKISTFYKNINNTGPLEDTLVFPKAKIYGQDIFRSKDINFYQKATNPNAPNNYEIGPGDQLSIAVWGNSDYTDVVKVNEGGYISPSGFGRIYVKGLTFEDAKSLIRKKLGMYNSQMEITLIYSRVILVNIVGEVYNPGSYAIPAINTAFNALMVANGPTQIGSIRNIYIKRNGEIVDSLDVYEFLFKSSEHKDIYLQDGDYILVSSASNLVEVKGEVNRPYTYEVKNTDNLKDLIVFAGGYTSEASKNIITLKRFENEGLLVHDVHQKDLSKTKLRSADEIIVNKIQRKISNFVSLEGTVGVEGDYEFVEGEKILDLLLRTNCINEYLFKERCYVLRKMQDGSRKSISVDLESVLQNPESNSNITLKEYDIVKVMSIDDFHDSYFVSVFGSVRNPGELTFGKGMKLSSAIELSGGLKIESSGGRIEISRVLEMDSNNLTTKRSIVLASSINSDLSLSPDQSNFILQNNDQIFIRMNPDYRDPINVKISGEVVYPGTYALITDGDRVSDLIQRSGGLTKNAFPDGVRLYRKTKIKEQEILNKIISEEFKEVILSDTSLYNMYSQDLLESEISKSSSLIETDKFEYTIVSFDLNKALKVDSKHNIVLSESDSLVIPKSIDIVYVTGSLYNYEEGGGISVPYSGAKRADYYINNFAGGYSKSNDRSRTVVVYPNGSVKKSIDLGLFSISPKVTKGSTIRVATKEEVLKSKVIPVDWNQAIENTLVKVTGVMSLYLLINRIQGSF